jgi:hypothetical protein
VGDPAPGAHVPRPGPGGLRLGLRLGLRRRASPHPSRVRPSRRGAVIISA